MALKTFLVYLFIYRKTSGEVVTGTTHLKFLSSYIYELHEKKTSYMWLGKRVAETESVYLDKNDSSFTRATAKYF